MSSMLCAGSTLRNQGAVSHMVARAIPSESDAPATSSGTVRRLFTTWRLLLTKFARLLVAAAEGVSWGPQRVTRSGGREVSNSLAWLFNGWRRLVSRVLSFIRLRERFAAARSACVDAYTLLSNPASFGSLDTPRADRLAALGLRAFVLGSAASIVVGMSTSGGPGPSIASVLNGVIWAAARLAILLALTPRDRRSRVLTAAVWSASLLPYLLGVTDALRWVALGASAFLCYGALSDAGFRRETVRTMTAWAFGGQAGVLVAGWLLRGALALLATS